MGAIEFVELDLETWYAPSNSILAYIKGTDGYSYSCGSILIDYDLITMDCIDILLDLMYADYDNLGGLHAIMIHMCKSDEYGDHHFQVEIVPGGNLPKIINVDDPDYLFIK